VNEACDLVICAVDLNWFSLSVYNENGFKFKCWLDKLFVWIPVLTLSLSHQWGLFKPHVEDAAYLD